MSDGNNSPSTTSTSADRGNTSLFGRFTSKIREVVSPSWILAYNQKSQQVDSSIQSHAGEKSIIEDRKESDNMISSSTPFPHLGSNQQGSNSSDDIGGGSFPAGGGSLPSGGGSLSLGGGGFPAGGGSVPAGGGSLPAGGGGLASGGGSLPMIGNRLPVGLGGGSLSIGSGNVPIGGSSVPSGGNNSSLGSNHYQCASSNISFMPSLSTNHSPNDLFSTNSDIQKPSTPQRRHSSSTVSDSAMPAFQKSFSSVSSKISSQQQSFHGNSDMHSPSLKTQKFPVSRRPSFNVGLLSNSFSDSMSYSMRQKIDARPIKKALDITHSWKSKKTMNMLNRLPTYSGVKGTPPTKKLQVLYQASIGKNYQDMARKTYYKPQPASSETPDWSSSMKGPGGKVKEKRFQRHVTRESKNEEEDHVEMPSLKTDFVLPIKTDGFSFNITPSLKSKDMNLNDTRKNMKTSENKGFSFSLPKDSFSAKRKNNASNLTEIGKKFRFSSPVIVSETDLNKDLSPCLVNPTSKTLPNQVATVSFGNLDGGFGSSKKNQTEWNKSPLKVTKFNDKKEMARDLKGNTDGVKHDISTDLEEDKESSDVDSCGSSGLAPARVLKKGSVMDILGKSDASFPTEDGRLKQLKSFLKGKTETKTKPELNANLSKPVSEAQNTETTSAFKTNGEMKIFGHQDSQKHKSQPLCHLPKSENKGKKRGVDTDEDTEDSCVPQEMKRFRKPAGEWDCDVCLVFNSATATRCIACETCRPGSIPQMVHKLQDNSFVTNTEKDSIGQTKLNPAVISESSSLISSVIETNTAVNGIGQQKDIFDFKQGNDKLPVQVKESQVTSSGVSFPTQTLSGILTSPKGISTFSSSTFTSVSDQKPVSNLPIFDQIQGVSTSTVANSTSSIVLGQQKVSSSSVVGSSPSLTFGQTQSDLHSTLKTTNPISSFQIGLASKTSLTNSESVFGFGQTSTVSKTAMTESSSVSFGQTPKSVSQSTSILPDPVAVFSNGKTSQASTTSTTVSNPASGFKFLPTSEAAPKSTSLSSPISGFSFGQTSVAAPQVVSSSSNPISSFTFVKTSQSATDSAPSAANPTSGFTFEKAPQSSLKSSATVPSAASGFSFSVTLPVGPDLKSAPQNLNFTFGKTQSDTTLAAPSIPSNFTFGQTTQVTTQTSSSVSNPLTFTFGKVPQVATDSTPNPVTGFAFGKTPQVTSDSTSTAPNLTSVFSFGQTPQTTPQLTKANTIEGFTFGQTPQVTPQSTSNSNSGFAFGQPTQAPSQSTSNPAGFTFGPSSGTAPQSNKNLTSGFGFGQTPQAAPQSTSNPSSGFTFGQTPAAAPQSSSNPSSGFTFGQTPQAASQSTSNPASGFAFGQTPQAASQSTSNPASGFSFGQTPQAASQSTSNPASGFAFGQTPATPAGSPFVFGQTQQQPPQSTPSLPNPATGFSFGQSPQVAPSPGIGGFSIGVAGNESGRKMKKAVRRIRR